MKTDSEIFPHPSDATAPKGRFHYGYTIVGVCCVIMMVCIGLTFSCAGIFYNPVSQSLGVEVGEFGLYMSLMYVASTLVLPIAGKMMERFSARWLLSLNAALMGGIFIWMGLSTRLWQFYVAGLLLGVTVAFLLYLSFPILVARWFRDRRGLMIGICSCASGIGGMVFNPIAGLLIEKFGWETAYIVFGLAVLCLVVPLCAGLLRNHPSDIGLEPFALAKPQGTALAKPQGATLPKESGTAEIKASVSQGKPEKTKESEGAKGLEEGVDIREAKKMPAFYAMILFAFLMMGVSTLNLFIPGYAQTSGFSLEAASLAAAFSMAGVTVGKLALGWLNDRSCRWGVAVTTIAGSAGLAVMTASGSWLAGIYLGAFLFGWAYAGVTVQTALLTVKAFGPKHYARINSVVSMGLSGGGAVASGGWGLLMSATSYGCIFLSGVAGLLLCLLIGLAVMGGKRG